MKHTTSAGKRSLIGALALSLMLGFGVCRPAATASAEEGGLLAEHKDEIVDAIVQAREDLRNTLDDIRAIRDEVKAREAAEEAEKSTQAPAQTPAEAESAPASGETAPAAPAETSETSDSSTDDSLRDTIRSIVQTRTAELDFEQTKETSAEQSEQAETPTTSDSNNDQSQQKTTTRSSGDSLISIDISDVTATLKDNPIEHNVPVNVFSNNKHFSDNTIVHQRVYESQRYYPSSGASDYTYSTAPKTGDANNIGLWVAAIGVSAAALAATLIILKKRKG